MNSKNKRYVDKRDAFEQRLGEQLRRATAPVPAGAWESIRAALNAGGTPTGVGRSAWWTGAAVATALLGSLAWYGAVHTHAPGDESTTANTETGARPGMDMSAAESSHEATTVVTISETDPVENPDAELAIKVGPDEKTDLVTAEDATQPKDPAIMETDQADVGTPATGSEATTDAGTPLAPFGENREGGNEAAQNSVLPIRVSHPSPLFDRDEDQARKAAAIDESSAEDSPQSGADAETLAFRIKTSGTSGYAPYTVALRAVGNAASYTWDLGRAGSVDGDHAQVTFEKPGTYTIYLFGADEQGDSRTKPVVVTVREGSNLVVPDSFTPNGDGLNDQYGVSGVGIERFELSIINAKGRTVFETQNMDEKWDFQAGGYPIDGEIYRVVLRAKGVDGKEYHITKRLNIIP